jgi:hypothetical protein
VQSAEPAVEEFGGVNCFHGESVGYSRQTDYLGVDFS